MSFQGDFARVCRRDIIVQRVLDDDSHAEGRKQQQQCRHAKHNSLMPLAASCPRPSSHIFPLSSEDVALQLGQRWLLGFCFTGILGLVEQGPLLVFVHSHAYAANTNLCKREAGARWIFIASRICSVMMAMVASVANALSRLESVTEIWGRGPCAESRLTTPGQSHRRRAT